VISCYHAATIHIKEHAMLTRLFLSHPAAVEESYLQHAAFASKFAGALFLAALAAFVHAIFPFMFEKTASKIIARLYAHTHDRGQ
jgi:hypothetical protein